MRLGIYWGKIKKYWNQLRFLIGFLNNILFQLNIENYQTESIRIAKRPLFQLSKRWKNFGLKFGDGIRYLLSVSENVRLEMSKIKLSLKTQNSCTILQFLPIQSIKDSHNLFSPNITKILHSFPFAKSHLHLLYRRP